MSVSDRLFGIAAIQHCQRGGSGTRPVQPRVARRRYAITASNRSTVVVAKAAKLSATP